MLNLHLWILCIYLAFNTTLPSKMSLCIQSALTINAFYSKQVPEELHCAAASLNMSWKLVSLYLLCMHLCAYVLFLYKTITIPNRDIKYDISLCRLSVSGGPSRNMAAEQTSWSKKKKYGEGGHLSWFKWILSEKKKTTSALVPHRQNDNNMKNSPIHTRGPSPSYWIPFSWLMSPWHSQQCNTVQAAVAFQFQM